MCRICGLWAMFLERKDTVFPVPPPRFVMINQIFLSFTFAVIYTFGKSYTPHVKFEVSFVAIRVVGRARSRTQDSKMLLDTIGKRTFQTSARRADVQCGLSTTKLGRTWIYVSRVGCIVGFIERVGGGSMKGVIVGFHHCSLAEHISSYTLQEVLTPQEQAGLCGMKDDA